MAALPTIAEVVERGYASISLSANYNSKASLFKGGTLNPKAPVVIMLVTYALDWGNEGGAQTEQSLRSTANYDIWLMGMFGAQAAILIAGGGGGSVTPITPGGNPAPYIFEVSDSSFIETGESVKQFPSTWVGREILFFRGTVLQSDINTGGTYYSWDSLNAILTLLPSGASGQASVGELFQIYPAQ